MKAAIIATTIFCALTATPALAYDCADIRAVVKMVGEKRAIKLAKEAGATEEQIRAARGCLKPEAR